MKYTFLSLRICHPLLNKPAHVDEAYFRVSVRGRVTVSHLLDCQTLRDAAVVHRESRGEPLMVIDPSFSINKEGLAKALALMERDFLPDECEDLPRSLPETGFGESATLERLAPLVLGNAARLDSPTALAHMDPPTPWITWAISLWNARLNQNLLHPAVSPFAREAESALIDWITPFFGMNGGHMTPGSSLANLTALWAARDVAGVRRVVASSSAHISIAKAARILGLEFETQPVDTQERLSVEALGDLSDACLVLTAGTTSTGAIDPLHVTANPAWTHVDAAWAGPLVFSNMHSDLLSGIEKADSIVVSAHKWLFQPKESAIVLFRDVERANSAISFSGPYLTTPGVGVLGSHGAMALPLLGTLMAWGRDGLARRIDICMQNADSLAKTIDANSGFELFAEPKTGVVVFRPKSGNVDIVAQHLTPTTASTTVINNDLWLRCVAANPNADMAAIKARIMP